jgi:hypothetical protein
MAVNACHQSSPVHHSHLRSTYVRRTCRTVSTPPFTAPCLLACPKECCCCRRHPSPCLLALTPPRSIQSDNQPPPTHSHVPGNAAVAARHCVFHSSWFPTWLMLTRYRLLRTIRMMAREQPNCRGSGSRRRAGGCKGRVEYGAVWGLAGMAP